MSAKIFSMKAELIWSAVPPEVREEILRAVWCGNCRAAVEIVDYTGGEERGDLIIEGRCRICGREVRRFVESSESTQHQN